MSEKIRPQHTARKAILYIRQSSAYQVSHNVESQNQRLGWREISNGRLVIRQAHVSAGFVIQGHNQTPIVSNARKCDIDGTLGMDGQSGSTKIWKNTVKGYDDVAFRTAQRQDRWYFRHGCSMKNVVE